MPSLKRMRTNYPGVFYIEGTAVGSGKPEKIFYIRYRKAGKMIEEKAGRQFQDDMTPARANTLRAERIQGKKPTRQEAREAKTKTKWTIDRLWQEYISDKPHNKAFSTDRGRYAKFLQPNFGSKEPKTVAQIDVHRLRITLAKSLKPKTVKNVLELLERIVNFGVKKGLCPGMSFKVEMPKVNNLKTEDLTMDQLSALIEAIDQDHDFQAANFLRMALVTGMRRGELFKLKWEDIDFDRGFIHIRQPKGGKDQTVPLNQAARNLLEGHLHTDSPYVFPGRGGKQRVEFRRPINRIRKRAGLPKDFRPLHGLRHVYASMLASSGQVDLYTLQKLLTHKTPAMTQRYAHLRRASDLAGELISQAINGNGKKVVNREE
jgi:integrase